ncbi:hypothetical protein DFS34DRAFT_638845 [Phlyctochytrium arcticum]|nr:hypothetical protein DFS34DRAFT_638845 [Phlyctochytrium arcticum]
MTTTLASQLGARRGGAAKIPFLILALCVPLLLGLLIGSSPTAVDASCTCHSDAPDTFENYLVHGILSSNIFTRVSCNYDVAIYMNSGLMNVDRMTTRWILPFYNKAWKFLKNTYGTCEIPRNLPAPIGPGCENFGEPKPLVAMLGDGQDVGNGFWDWRVRFDSDTRTDFRHFLAQGNDDWGNDYEIKVRAMNLLCRSVEVGSQGIHLTPVRDVWGDGYFSDMCTFDFFNRSGYAAEASRFYTEQMENVQSAYPPDTQDAIWFRNWYYPLWVQYGNTLAWHNKFFALLSRYFPTELSGNGINLVYTGQMNVGEYVHFMSATVGRSLIPMAISAFNSGYKPAQLDDARLTFPDLNSMYTYP